MKKILNLFIAIIVATILLSFNIYVYADKTDITQELYKWDPSRSLEDEPELTEKAGTILGAINVVGVIVSVITVMAIGIKYMVGSVEEKADYKGVMIPWLIGAVLLFSGTTIPNVIYNVAHEAGKAAYCPTCHTEVYHYRGRYYCDYCDNYVYSPIYE